MPTSNWLLGWLTLCKNWPPELTHDDPIGGTGHYYFGMPRTTRSSPTRTGRSGKLMYQADALGLFKVVSVTTWGHILDAIVSRAYEQVGDDHAPGRWQERDADRIMIGIG
jgi:hypothetical protein